MTSKGVRRVQKYPRNKGTGVMSTKAKRATKRVAEGRRSAKRLTHDAAARRDERVENAGQALRVKTQDETDSKNLDTKRNILRKIVLSPEN